MIDYNELDYNELDYKDGYTLVERDGEYSVLDKSGKAIVKLASDGEDWKDFLESMRKQDTSLLAAVSSTDTEKRILTTSDRWVKSTCVGNINKNYSGKVYIIKNGNNSYAKIGNKNVTNYPDDTEIAVFSSKDLARNARYHKGLDDSYDIVKVEVTNGRLGKFLPENIERDIDMKRASEMLYDDKEISSEEAYKLGVYGDILIDVLGVSEEAVTMVVNILGRTKETYDKILYQATGYNDLSQIDN